MKRNNSGWIKDKISIRQELKRQLQPFLASFGIETEILADAIDSVLAEVDEDFEYIQTQILGLVLWRIFAGESGLWIGCRTPAGNAIPANILVVAYKMWDKAMEFAKNRKVDSLTAASVLIQAAYVTVDMLAGKNTITDVQKYLFGTYRNIISKNLRENRENFYALPPDATFSDNGIFSDKINDTILCREILDLMPPQGRRVTALRYLAGLSWQEIANVMGISVNAAQKALSVGIKKAFGVCMRDLQALGNPGRKKKLKRKNRRNRTNGWYTYEK